MELFQSFAAGSIPAGRNFLTFFGPTDLELASYFVCVREVVDTLPAQLNSGGRFSAPQTFAWHAPHTEMLSFLVYSEETRFKHAVQTCYKYFYIYFSGILGPFPLLKAKIEETMQGARDPGLIGSQAFRLPLAPPKPKVESLILRDTHFYCTIYVAGS